ncbi:EXS family-domain-containing protein [Lactarius quietus]|nr:EXS family-domain-containing protein [Lactarius quietus]
MDNETDDLSFVVAFPLPFRVLFLAGAGILGWSANLHGLRLLGIDAASALDLHVHEHGPLTPLPVRGPKALPDSTVLYAPVYRLALWYGLWCTFTWLLYHSATHSTAILVDYFKYIPAVCALVVFICAISPYDVLQKRERDAFLMSMKRCIYSPLNHRIHFSDVIFADIFTSYAKVLGDVWLSLCMLLPGGSLLTPPAQEGLYRWILPTLMSLPYLVRFRQCMVEYTSPLNDSRRPLWNALKYSSSFPVIFLSAAQRLVVSDLIAKKGDEVKQEAWHGEHALFRLWLLAALVNSLYSFWWDVTNDWGFDLLQFRPKTKRRTRSSSMPRPLILPAMHHREESVTSPRNSLTSPASSSRPSPRAHPAGIHPFGLRSRLLYPLPIYPIALFVNLILRLTWSIKLSSHLHARAQGEGSLFIFWVEVAEIVRRWVWVFIRVEWEIVKRAQESGGYTEITSGSEIDADADSYELRASGIDETNKLEDRHS